jgi:hypothetical protein
MMQSVMMTRIANLTEARAGNFIKPTPLLSKQITPAGYDRELIQPMLRHANTCIFSVSRNLFFKYKRNGLILQLMAQERAYFDV